MNRFEYPARLRRIVDGDSLRIDFDLGFGLRNENVAVRLFGVDTPELFSGSPLERSAGLSAKLFVEGWMDFADDGSSSFPLRVRTVDRSKYGDWLARIWCGLGDELGLRLLDEGMGRVYLGEKKKPWGDQTLREIVAHPVTYPNERRSRLGEAVE